MYKGCLKWLLLDPAAEGEDLGGGIGNSNVMPKADYSKVEELSVEDFFSPAPLKVKEEPKVEEEEVETEKVETKVEAKEAEKVEETEAETETKVEPKVETEPEAKQQQQQQQVQPDPLAERFPEATAFIKQMSKPAREYMAARLREVAQLESRVNEMQETLKQAQQGRYKVPDSYYENPHAYTLLPEYQVASHNTSLAAKIEAHWAEQHKRIATGEPWFDIEEVKDRNGNLIDIKPARQAIKPDGESQHEVSKWWRSSEVQLERLLRDRDGIAQSFAEQQKSVTTRLTQAESDLFPAERWAAKDSVEVKTLDSVRSGLKELGVSEHNPLFGLLAKTGAALILERQTRQALTKKEAIAKSISKDKVKAGPTGGSTVGGGSGSGGNSKKEITFDDFLGSLPASRY